MMPVGRFPSCLDAGELPDQVAAHLGEGFVESGAHRRRDKARPVGDGGLQRRPLATRVTLFHGQEQIDGIGPE